MASLLQSRRPEVVSPTQIARPYANQIFVLAAAVVPLIAMLLLVRIPLVLPSLVSSRSPVRQGLRCWRGGCRPNAPATALRSGM